MQKPDDYASILCGVTWFQFALVSVFVALRMYTRHYITRNLSLDDVLILVNLVIFASYATCVSTGASFGVGKHIVDIQRLGLNNSKAIMWEVISQGICIMGAAVSKASVALFLLRTTVKRWHVVLLWICIASTTFLCTVTTILMFVQCKPVSFLWNQTIEYGHCWLAFTDVELIMGAWSTAINFLLALLPWHVITSLNMNRSEKATIACGLSLGVLAGACSLVRTIELKPLSSMDNYVYDTSSMLLWFSSEVCLTIICACIPVLRPLYIRVTSGNKDDSLEEISYPSSTFGKREKRQSSLSYKKVSRASLPRIFMGPIGGVMQTIINPGRDDESEMSILRGGNEQKFGCFLCLDDAERGDVQTRDIVVTTSIVTNEEVGSMV